MFIKHYQWHNWAVAGFSVVALFFVARIPVKNDVACPVREEVKIIRGSSMYPLLKSGDEVHAVFGYYECHSIRRGEVVLLTASGRKNLLIKMVRAIPGDTFSLSSTPQGSEPLVNGEKLLTVSGASYLFRGEAEKILSLYERDYHGVIPPNAYLVLGEMVNGSFDSSHFGLISKKEIVARVER